MSSLKDETNRKRTITVQKHEVNLSCYNSDKMRKIFENMPYDSFSRHRDMFCKMLISFMFEHEILNYTNLYIYKINLRVTKNEIEGELLNIKQNNDRILLLGVKKHLLIAGQELDTHFCYRMFIKSSFMKVSIVAAASIALNHIRYNRLPIFTKFPKPAFAKFIEVCFMFSEN